MVVGVGKVSHSSDRYRCRYSLELRKGEWDIQLGMHDWPKSKRILQTNFRVMEELVIG